MNQKQGEKWKKVRDYALGHHLIGGKLRRAATVRVNPDGSGWRTVFEWRRPKPTFMQVNEKGLTFLRGEEPQDDSVLQGKESLHIPWKDVASLEFNKWFKSAVEIRLKSGHHGFESIFVRWMADSSIKPYNIYQTEAIYRLLDQYVENHGRARSVVKAKLTG